MIESFNFLIVGRSGSGKSATTRLLTGQQSIDSKISPNSVTRQIAFYQSTSERIESTKINFCVLDIPGLDQLPNRKTIRQTIFTQFKKRKLEIHAIIYAVDCVARDTVDNKKIFRFLNELPWALKDIKEHVIPILTKYDNLVFDAEDQNTQKTLNEFAHIFFQNGYGQSWKSNALYWVNDTKNIIKKMNICQSIREVYENQIQNLVKTVRKIKSVLTYEKIERFLQQQKKYVDKRIKMLIKAKEIPLQSLNYTICHSLKIELSNKLNTKSFAAFTIGSFGVILSRIVKNDLLKGVLALTSMVSSGLIIKNYMNEHQEVQARKQKQLHRLDLLYPENYLIMKLNQLILNRFQSFEHKLQFKIEGNTLRIKIPQDFDGEYFLIESVECYFEDDKMDKEVQVGVFTHKLEDVHSKILEADVKMVLQLRVPDQNSLLANFEQQSSKFKQLYEKGESI